MCQKYRNFFTQQEKTSMFKLLYKYFLKQTNRLIYSFQNKHEHLTKRKQEKMIFPYFPTERKPNNLKITKKKRSGKYKI